MTTEAQVGEEQGDKLKVVDLFCGCGGLSKGFRDAGFDVVAGFDNWELALETYRLNLPEPAVSLDLSDVDDSVRAVMPFMDGVSGIIGGPPCQDFSSAGKRVEADRADLTERYAEIVAALHPSFFLMENVPRAQKAAAFRRAIDVLAKAGYHITEQIVDASKVGVPQRRKRLITVGFLAGNENNEFSECLLSGMSSESTTMRDYFGESLGTEFIYRHPRSYARRAIFSVDEPCPTIRGVNRPIPSGYPGHTGDAAPVSEARPLSTEERGRVQTFPHDWVWVGSKTDREQAIGNAVPVVLASYVGKCIGSYLSKEHTIDSTVG